jgi:dTDP-4-dehydrorhamnose 3,5-epimerase
MKIITTKFDGLFVIEFEKFNDERGFFARTFCEKEFEKAGIKGFKIVQSSVSGNIKAGTLRGMHFQKAPHEASKIVTCIRGKIFDVALDLRPQSETFMQYFSIELSQDSNLSMFIPVGFAHGFQTIVDNSIVEYSISEFYYPELASGVRWDDPAFKIAWPECKNRIISKFDKNLVDFKPSL